MIESKSSGGARAYWYRVIIESEATPASFINLIQSAVNHVPSTAVLVNRLEVVTCSNGTKAPFSATNAIPVDLLLRGLESVTQVVWGRFFFFGTSEDSEQANAGQLEECIAMSKMTISVVDGFSYFIFTTSFALVCELLNGSYRCEVIKDELPKVLLLREDF